MDKKCKTRILFISHDCDLGGAELSLLNLLSGLDKNSFDPFILAPCQGPLTEEIERLGTTLYIRFVDHWIPYWFQFDWRHLKKFLRTFRARVWSIATLIERHHVDIVYTNTVTCIDGAIAAYITKKPHIWHVREHVRGNNAIRPYVPAMLVPWIVSACSDRVVTNSKSLCANMTTYRSNGKISFVYNGVDLQEFTTSHVANNNLRRELAIPEGTKLVAIIGAVTPHKGLDLFVESARKVKDTFKDVAFIVVGPGRRHFVETIKQKVYESGLRESFYFLGLRNDIPCIMAAIDLLVLSSKQEAFGRVIIEAMAASKPVVCTKCGGPEEIVIDGKTGFLVPVGNPSSMANAIIGLLKNGSLAISIGQAGRQRAEKLFDSKIYVRKIETIITELTNQKAKRVNFYRPLDK